MQWISHHRFDVITRCIAGGANPVHRAEIRAPSVRGQLRWWFRVLGGFSSMAKQSVSVSDQENILFGTVSDRQKKSQAGLLMVRVAEIAKSRPLYSTKDRDCKKLGIDVNSSEGYLLFPLRSNEKKKEYAGRAMFDFGDLPSFDLRLGWRRGNLLREDIEALVAVFAHLGSLGMRSRRCMGALASNDVMPLDQALALFDKPNVRISALPANTKDAKHAVTQLADWLKHWRSYGRSPDTNNKSPGFEYAKQDHDLSVAARIGKPVDGPSYRPALGLPIITHKYADWNAKWDAKKRKGQGRFASPILLRPRRLSEEKWQANIIFVDALAWPEGRNVYLDNQEVSVSGELYNRMRSDPDLQNIWPITSP